MLGIRWLLALAVICPWDMECTALDPERVDDGLVRNRWVLWLPPAVCWCPEGSAHMRRGSCRQCRGCTDLRDKRLMCCSCCPHRRSGLLRMAHCTRGSSGPVLLRIFPQHMARVSKYHASMRNQAGKLRSRPQRREVPCERRFQQDSRAGRHCHVDSTRRGSTAQGASSSQGKSTPTGTSMRIPAPTAGSARCLRQPRRSKHTANPSPRRPRPRAQR